MQVEQNQKSSAKLLKELRLFSLIGLALSVLSLFVIGWISIAALGACGRSIMLSRNNELKESQLAKRYRLFAVIGLLIALLSFGVMQIANS